MGACASVDSTRSGAYRSNNQKALQVHAADGADEDKQEEAYKLLLLGCSDAGKSTLFKQFMLLLSQNTPPPTGSAASPPASPPALTPFSPDIHRAYISAISRNMLQGMRTLLTYSLKLDAAHRTRYSSQVESAAEAVRTFTFPPLQPSLASNFSSPAPIPVDKLPADVLQHLRTLWRDEGIQHEYEREEYCPSFQDLLQARARTVGLVQSSMLRSENAPSGGAADIPHVGAPSCTYFQFIDCGGRRADRRNWFHALNASMVRGVFFVVNLSEYDQTVPEDPRMNRMAESLALWTEVVNSRFLYKEPIVLLLNKVDLFRDKLIHRKISLTTAFPDYIPSSSSPATSVDSAIAPATAAAAAEEEHHAIAFIKKQFEERHEFAGKKQVFIHVVNALDLDTVQHAFHAVKPIILKSAQQRI